KPSAQNHIYHVTALVRFWSDVRSFPRHQPFSAGDYADSRIFFKPVRTLHEDSKKIVSVFATICGALANPSKP
ncbi:MAG: hypothetical protein ABIO62_04135, partial [Paracoccaceae bacterium]